jgi:hypothetical protein
MAAPLTAAAVAADIQRDDGPEAETLLAAFQASPAEGKRILEELASHRDPVVRAWAPWAARRSLSKPDAVALALRLVRDRDSDVRDVALEELLELDLQAAAKLAPTFRQKLKSKEFYEPITGMWALAAIHDAGAVSEIRAAADHWDNALHKNTAEVVCMLLGGRGNEVVRLIRDHDHRLMPWLSKAARLLRTNEARHALADCARHAPDDECRNSCQESIAKMTSPFRPPSHSPHPRLS